MEKRPLLSVVIITYNAATTIEKPIKSLLNQENFKASELIELIIVDDKSTDNTIQICDKYKNKFANYIYHILPENNHKLGALRYAGTNLATGEWITYLDSDDIFLDNVLNEYFLKFRDSYIRENLNNHRLTGIWAHEYYKPFEIETDKLTDNFSTGHLHGKFYSLDFMKEKNINFDPTMGFEEDLYFNIFFNSESIIDPNNAIIEQPQAIYLYEGSPNSICHSKQKKSVESGILYPDHHLITYKDYVHAATYHVIRLYKETKSEMLRNNVCSVIYSLYYAINFYYSLKQQFDHISEEFYQFLNEAKYATACVFHTLPPEITQEYLELFAYRNPGIVKGSEIMMNGLYHPNTGWSTDTGIPVQSLHEFLTDMFKYN